MQVTVLLFMQLLYLSSAVRLKVGIYNEIPDLGNDGLVSYKNMIQNGFNDDDHEVDAVVDASQYSPYENLNDYLSADGFDLIEIDTATLQQVVEDGLVKEITSLPNDIMPAAASAVTINGQLYAYPTLLCGNFLIGLNPGTNSNCPLREARENYEEFHRIMEEDCIPKIPGNWRRIPGGKMNDEGGWYLPFLYVDGYIDIHGMDSVARAVEEVIKGVIDPDVCERLSWYIGCCNDRDGVVQNKCYVDFEGSYVCSSSNVYPDIENGETVFFFGFSEKLGLIVRDTDRKSYAAISGPLGELNHLLQFTDALVINKARWNAANEEKRNAIQNFVDYFLSNSLRYKIAMGEDLNPPQNRYLLQATETFYESTNDIIYQDIYWSLQRAAAAPSLTSYERKEMQKVLAEKCVVIPQAMKSKEEL